MHHSRIQRTVLCCFCCSVHLVTRRRSEAAGGEQDWQILVLDRNEDLYIEEKLVKALTVEHLRHCQE